MKIDLISKKIVIFDLKAKEIYNQKELIIKDNKLELNINNLINGKNIFKFIDNKGKQVKSNLQKPFYFNDDENYYYAYNSKNDNLIISVGKTIETNANVICDKVKLSKNSMDLHYHLMIKNPWEKINSLSLVERETKEEIKIKINKKRGVLKVLEFPTSGVYDLFCEVLINNDITVIKKLGKYNYTKELFLKDGILKGEIKSSSISPYTTYKASKLCFKVDIIKTEYLKQLKSKKNSRDVWLIDEQKNKAQDNGFYLFKYLRENHPEVKAFYVIEEDSIDFKKVEKLSNVIKHGSKEHYQIIPKIKYLISTHHPDYLLPISNVSILDEKHIFKIFLQHGVMGTKYMANFYGKYSNNPFDVDLFITSSNREKEMIVDDFGYEDEEVVVTGLARFDNLLKKDIEESNDILIIPTWRDWLSNEIDFEETEYFKRYVSLNLALKDKFKIKFILHINMAQYKDIFRNMGIETYSATDVNVQDLMKESKLMITDYSSVSFDFSFLKKPVIYYQFDKERFFGSNGSHFDIYKELPGYIVEAQKEVESLVNKLKENDYIQEEKIFNKSSNLLEFRDLNSSKRIYEEILKCNKKSKKKLFKKKFFKKAFNFYRRSLFYYPSMKLLYNTLKFFPKKDYVFLESSNGKSFSDSPKEIYLEWIKQDPKKNFIVAYNGRLDKSYKNIKVVKRLSPEYFYYLSRSKFWITNQNLPYYIKNYKTIYLQTWHGTPLKNMLHDIKEIKGRDDGYKKRVSKAIKQWTYLLSPSSYASECFRSAFKYDDEILEYGYPRNDVFFKKNKNLENHLKEKYSIKNKKVILFAPTFRDDGIKKGNKYLQDLNLNYKKLYKELKDEYLFIIKLHPLSLIDDTADEYDDFIKFSDVKEDISDVMLITDILITDYSSVMFDFLITNKKTLIYSWDYETYSANRGFYLDFEKDVPGEICNNFDQLLEGIKRQEINYDIKKYQKKYSNKEDGNASKRVVDTLKNL